MTPTPYFSIIVPVYNRVDLVGRAIASCLRQDFPDFEIVVVDDGSVDGSPEAVRRHSDRRVRLLCHDTNRGRCPARNTGARAARGEWLVFLDSDDELLDGALTLMHSRIAATDRAVDKLFFGCRWSDGTISPDPPPKGEVWDYGGYIRWLETMVDRPSECLPCTRRTPFLEAPYAEGHAQEGLHNLDFARRFRTLGCADIVRLYHLDAGNRVMRLPARMWIQYAPDYADELDQTFARHGAALTAWAPSLSTLAYRLASLYHFLAGNRRKGVRYMLQHLKMRPFSGVGWAVLVLGLAGPRFLAAARARRA